ncbi:ATP-binding protein [Sphingopyxis sp. C-1]|uniref:ATP-binding protein n=1 Tax=Sphingopyxis sp. C-1 TaxID=262667 RepID=UPI000AC13A6C|nr:ATP-binding protein [Sphingopyxis sp. C-1]
MPKVIYLTGAPAAGKSSTTKELSERIPDLVVWEYGARLTEHCANKFVRPVTQDELRAKSAAIVTPDDVRAVDTALLSFVRDHRTTQNLLIDTHAVTKENYGFRITPFSVEQFAELAPDEIWVFYVGPDETRERIEKDAGGRPVVSEEDARMHTMLQASVAATYSMSIGCPAYLFDTSAPREQLIALLVDRLK